VRLSVILLFSRIISLKLIFFSTTQSFFAICAQNSNPAAQSSHGYLFVFKKAGRTAQDSDTPRVIRYAGVTILIQARPRYVSGNTRDK
jgi:hypothetical protein